MLHINLPPSTRPAGVVALSELDKRVVELNTAILKSGRPDLKQDLERIQAEIIQLKGEIDTDPIHKRVYIFGTDYLGRDMLARTIYGGQISIMIGLIGTITAAFIGILLGSLGGYIGGWLDNLIGRFVLDLMYNLPYMLLVIIIMSMLPWFNSIFVLFTYNHDIG
ncbi:hypothetical protein MASR2M48_04080 [Spirochaetota bacterium]